MQGAFTPSDAQIDRARRILTSFVAYKNIGAGAFSLDGMMIDMPTVLQAHNVVKLARVAQKIGADDLQEVDALIAPLVAPKTKASKFDKSNEI